MRSCRKENIVKSAENGQSFAFSATTHKLIIAEKPSVAKNIVEALEDQDEFKKENGYYQGNQYIVSWLYGHLYTLYDVVDYKPEWGKNWRLEHYPFIPEHFRYKAIPNKGVKQQIETLRKLVEVVESVYEATDNDREGQLIADLIVHELQVAKPVFRVLLNEWTKDAVLRGINQAVPREAMIPLFNAGIARQWSDWLIGINLTVVTTLVLGGGKQTIPVGRVVMPTLKIIYDREQEILHFKSEKRYKIGGQFKTETGEIYEGILELEENGKIVKFFESRNEALDLLEKLKPSICQNAFVAEIVKEEKRQYAPRLFSLTTLQGNITSSFAEFSSEKVLNIAQKLYEKKLITYPRTNSVALEESLKAEAQKVFVKHCASYPAALQSQFAFNESKRIFDNKKVESHSAIIPTVEVPHELSTDEQLVYEVIKNRFMSQFLPPAVYEDAWLFSQVEDTDYRFKSKGRIEKERGWKVLYSNSATDVVLPKLQKNDCVTVENFRGIATETKPPQHHTEKTLLNTMETCGKRIDNEEERITAVLSGFSIGTSSTRADTIEKLLKRGLIKKKGKSLLITDLGRSLCENFPVEHLFDLNYTGEMEYKLSLIEKSQYEVGTYIKEIKSFVEESVVRIKSKDGMVLEGAEREVIGKCPRCGKNIYEGKKGFYCCSIKGKTPCGFFLSKNQKILRASKKHLTKGMVRKMLAGQPAEVNGLISKNARAYKAKFVLDDTGSWVNLKMLFD